MSIVGVVFLGIRTVQVGGTLVIASCGVYGFTLMALYLASTLYHSAPSGTRARNVLRIVDHSAIYLLIAGTYTPFTLISLRGPWGWSLFGVIWGLAALGILFKMFFTGRWEIFSGLVYLFMGWLAVVAFRPLLASVPPGGLAWMVAGGLAYTLGMIFYAWAVVPHHHAIWHLFVMLGSVCHFVSILVYVVPAVP